MEASHPPHPDQAGDALTRVTSVLDRTLRVLGDRLDYDLAARFAAEAWWALESESPKEAERINRTMHYLTARMARHGARATTS